MKRYLHFLTYVVLMAGWALPADAQVTHTALSIAGYEFRLVAPSDTGPVPMEDLVVTRHDSTVWRLEEHLILVLNSDSLHLPASLIGDGTPEVIVETYSGGAHCCFEYYLVRLGSQFSVLDTIHGAARFEADSLGSLVVHVNDYVFDYWQMPHSDSPLPEVIMKFSAGRFRMARDLMKQPPPDSVSLEKMATEIRGIRGWRGYPLQSEFLPAPMVALTAQMVHLIYTGNADAARKLAWAAWPRFLRGEPDFVTDLFTQLRKSPYYGGIRDLNQW
jgi:hypothetical protein